MKYGDTIKGECKYCDCVNLYFLKRKESKLHNFPVTVKHLEVMCQCCRTVQLIKEE